VPSSYLPVELVEAAGQLGLDLRVSLVVLLQLEHHADGTVDALVQTTQLVTQLLANICRRTDTDTQPLVSRPTDTISQ